MVGRGFGPVILSEAKDLFHFAQGDSEKLPGISKIKKMPRSFVAPTKGVGTPQDDKPWASEMGAKHFGA